MMLWVPRTQISIAIPGSLPSFTAFFVTHLRSANVSSRGAPIAGGPKQLIGSATDLQDLGARQPPWQIERHCLATKWLWLRCSAISWGLMETTRFIDEVMHAFITGAAPVGDCHATAGRKKNSPTSLTEADLNIYLISLATRSWHGFRVIHC